MDIFRVANIFEQKIKKYADTTLNVEQVKATLNQTLQALKNGPKKESLKDVDSIGWVDITSPMMDPGSHSIVFIVKPVNENIYKNLTPEQKANYVEGRNGILVEEFEKVMGPGNKLIAGADVG